MKLNLRQTLQTLKITDMKPQDARLILTIADECGLSFWSEADYRIETERKDSFVKTAQLNGKTVGFIVMRLIMIQTLACDNSLIRLGRNNLNTQNLKSTENSENIKITENKEIESAEFEIYNIGVKKAYQRRGIGFALMDALIKSAAVYKNAVIWLDVRESNDKAINFYKAHKFEICYKRKNFYNNPPQDAVVMKLAIGNKRTLKTKNTENTEKSNLLPEGDLS